MSNARVTIFSKLAKRGFEKYVSTHLLCAGHGPVACWCAPRAYQLSNTRQA